MIPQVRVYYNYHHDVVSQIAEPLSDWLYQKGRIICNTSYHLSCSNPTPQLISSLSDISLKYTLEDMSLCVMLHPQGLTAQRRPFSFGVFFLLASCLSCSAL